MILRLLRLRHVLFEHILEELDYLLEECRNRLEELDKSVGYYLIIISDVGRILIEKIAERLTELTHECEVARCEKLIEE